MAEAIDFIAKGLTQRTLGWAVQSDLQRSAGYDSLRRLGIMKAWKSILTISALVCSGVGLQTPDCHAATVNLVVMGTNPNGTPTLGNQYVLGLQVAGTSGPTFLGSNLITFSGSLGNDDSPGTPSGSLYSVRKVLFQSEADLANTNDAANYARRNDSYFASPFRTLFTTGGANETATTLSIDAAAYGVLPSKIPGDGTYNFAFINVTGAAGVEFQGEFFVGSTPFPIGNGGGLKLALNGQLVPLVGVPGDYNSVGTVNAADYVAWRKAGSLQNDPTPGVQPADYDFWRSRFGATTGASAMVNTVPAAIPEPSSLALKEG